MKSSRPFTLGVLVPLRKNAKPAYYIAAREKFQHDSVRLVFGLDSDDAIGKLALKGEHNIVYAKPEFPFPVCHLWSEMAKVAFDDTKNSVDAGNAHIELRPRVKFSFCKSYLTRFFMVSDSVGR
jgi:hypothetical protein